MLTQIKMEAKVLNLTFMQQKGRRKALAAPVEWPGWGQPWIERRLWSDFASNRSWPTADRLISITSQMLQIVWEPYPTADPRFA